MTDNGQEIRAIAELAVDVKYMRKELDILSKRMDLAATKEDIANLRKEIEDNSPSALFRSITKIASGLVVLAAAGGVVIALLRFFK